MRRTFFGGLAAALAFSTLSLVAAGTVAPAADAAAARATTTKSTTSKFDPKLKKTGYSGDYLSISGAVKTGTGDSPLAGTALLQKRPLGSKKWKTVAKDTSPGYAYFPKMNKFTTNFDLRIVFTGGTYKGGSTDIKYEPSVSKVLPIRAGRHIEFKDVTKGRGNPTAKIHVFPDFGRSKFILQRKYGKKFKTIRKVKTSVKGIATVTVQGSSKGITYRVIAPGGRQYVATATGFTGYVYR